jgi:hypothetical protein
MARATSFVARWRVTFMALTVAVAATVVWLASIR